MDIYRDGKRRGSRLWGAFEKRNMVAVVLLSISRGKVGFLYYCPTSSRSVDEAALRDLVSAASTGALNDGVPVVQAFAAPDSPEDIAMLTEAGMRKAAELIHMNCSLSNVKLTPSLKESEFEFVTINEINISTLTNLIPSTYIDSLDCPKMLGIRKTKDVIESHKNTGIYSPSTWYIAMADGRPAGCVLLNSSSRPGFMELVYMGVAPEFRGRGLGRRMIMHSINTAFSCHYASIHLAVDAGNIYAKRVYEEAGFRPDYSVLVFAKF